MSDKGTYGGFTYGIPWLGGLGGGLYIDNSGRLYPQLYYGTPGFGASAGYTNDLGALLTGRRPQGASAEGGSRATSRRWVQRTALALARLASA